MVDTALALKEHLKRYGTPTPKIVICGPLSLLMTACESASVYTASIQPHHSMGRSLHACPRCCTCPPDILVSIRASLNRLHLCLP